MHTGPSSSSAAEQRARLLRRGLWLEYITLGWNVVGVVVLAIAAFAAHSVALAGFGRDSLIEILASTVVVWQLTDTAGDREHVAMRVIGGAFFALAVYIAAQAIYQLASGRPPAPSPLGIVWTAITCAAMLALAFGKARTGAALDNPVLTTEGRVTLVDAYLAGAVLVGLVLNAAWGWGWADPLASFVIVFYGLKEGWEALQPRASTCPGPNGVYRSARSLATGPLINSCRAQRLPLNSCGANGSCVQGVPRRALLDRKKRAKGVAGPGRRCYLSVTGVAGKLRWKLGKKRGNIAFN